MTLDNTTYQCLGIILQQMFKSFFINLFYILVYDQKQSRHSKSQFNWLVVFSVESRSNGFLAQKWGPTCFSDTVKTLSLITRKGLEFLINQFGKAKYAYKDLIGDFSFNRGLFSELERVVVKFRGSTTFHDYDLSLKNNVK